MTWQHIFGLAILVAVAMIIAGCIMGGLWYLWLLYRDRKYKKKAPVRRMRVLGEDAQENII